MIQWAGDSKAADRDPYMKYKPLPEGHIRLLKIKENPYPSNLEEEIAVELTTVSLTDHPPYIALSYTWGDPVPYEDPTTAIFTNVPRCFPIICGGRLVLSTRNLRSALRRLRQLDYIQTSAKAGYTQWEQMAEKATKFNKNIHLYWIDAICINQEDLQERSRQVMLMDKIYRQAEATIVWLGERNEYTLLAIRVLCKIAGIPLVYDTLAFDDKPQAKVPDFEGVHTLSDLETVSLVHLFTRNWISRTWILQEAILSQSVATLWGGFLFSLNVLTEAGSQLSLSRSYPKLLGRLLRIGSNSQLETKFRDSWKAILEAPSTLTWIGQIRARVERKRKPDFMETVEMCSISESTDPRDKIYGIFGIAAELEARGKHNYRPDYTLTVAEVYAKSTAFVIKSRDDLACLSLSLAIVENSVLRVDGAFFDILADTSTIAKGLPDNLMNHGLGAVLNLATHLEPHEEKAAQARKCSAPFEMLLPDIDLMRQWIHRFTRESGPDAEYLQIFEKALGYAGAEEYYYASSEQGDPAPGGNLLQAMKSLDKNFLGNLSDGRLNWVYFRTGNTLGVGLPSARSGDEIWFLHGAFAPVILRPLPNGNYRFMGEAYVHGVMYGEAGAQCETHRVINIE
ncbi:MAG: hypothetical protein Q9225_006144 [Loekoesia sp. 1 TL-2023]